MDKPRDVRRGASRFSTAKRHIKQSGHKLFGGIGGDYEFSEKSKKEKVRSLSAVGRALSNYKDYDMGCNTSEKLDALPAQPPPSSIIASKRFKFPTKYFNDCNGVDHASVPRKLRSAMKKRNRESILPDSQKVNYKMNGIESPEKDGIKKSKVIIKQGSSDWSPRQIVSGPITKDEEEVAETLYALAGMFPDNGLNDRSELDGESLPDKSSVLQDVESANAAFEASGIAQDASASCAGRSPGGAAKSSSFNETVDQERPDLPESGKFLVASDSTAPKMNLPTIPMLVRSETANKVALHDSELRLATGLNMSRQSLISHIERKPEMALETARANECKQEQHMIKDQKKNGPALWPGLSPIASAGNHASYLQSSAAKAPVWLDTAICASKQDIMECRSSGGKISEIVNHKRSWKRCAAHVHISHLIRSLQVPHSKDMLLQQPNQSNLTRAHEGLKRGVIMEVHNFNGMRNGFTCAPGTGHAAVVKNSHEAKNCILQQQRHYHDISQAAPTPAVYGPQKQSFDFLSLSAEGSGLKVNNSFNKVGSRLEPFSRLQSPYFQSLAQQNGLMSISMPQSQYASSPYLDQISVAGPQVRLQLPHYYGSPLSGTHNSITASNKHQHQNFWAVQLAAQGRSSVNCNIMRPQYPNWQCGRQESPAVSACSQATLPHSPASLEVLGSKMTPIFEQQQQLMALASSLPSSRTNGLEFHLPSVCEESRGRFRGSDTPSLQLLCDDLSKYGGPFAVR